ncbi:hypothetical protein PoB_000536100 [Plakobranchus ocellatus]|uniref:C2H2-type domain-containing protein n=1 Tax=Plakobranchus ocellatus TaxID=259542 RepID=A0AAV3Y6M8_9GAST|nr:hypothetical protein PoB_000536100 [Plakobranchus ocellatus]
MMLYKMLKNPVAPSKTDSTKKVAVAPSLSPIREKTRILTILEPRLKAESTECALYFPSAASMNSHKKGVHQKAGAVNENEEVLHISDEHLSCSDDEDGEERDDAVACENNIGAAFMDSDSDKMPV